MDRAMWVYLNVPEAFEEAAMFARADALAAGRFWVKRNSLPAGKISVDGKVRQTFENALSEHYWPTQMRGKYCTVEHYQRANGVEYFFAYLDDYPDNHLVFDDTGQIERRADRYAFTNVFAFNPEEGALELFARGGRRSHWPLQWAFCRSVLGLDVGRADPLRPGLPTRPSARPELPAGHGPVRPGRGGPDRADAAGNPVRAAELHRAEGRPENAAGPYSHDDGAVPQWPDPAPAASARSASPIQVDVRERRQRSATREHCRSPSVARIRAT